jgi:long-chain acyl-CoA synthetase
LASEQTIRDLLTNQARRFQKRTFLECGDQHYSYAAVDDLTDHLATGLSRLGLRAGERVAILLPNCPEIIFYLLGTLKIGIVAVPIDAGFAPEDIVFALQHSGASAVVAEARFHDLRGQVSGSVHWIEPDDPSFSESHFCSLTDGPVLGFWPDLDSCDPALIYYSRSSDGIWKPVVLTHRNLVSNCFQILQPFRIDEADRFLCTLPLSSVAGLVLLVLVPWASGAVSILQRVSRTPMLEGVRESRATVLAAAPDLFEIMADSKEFSDTELSSLRLAICTSGPVGERILQEFQNRHDVLIVEGYGPSEASGLCCANPYTGVRKPGSIGLPLPGVECRIVDYQGRELPAGRTGEIIVRGPNVMRAYYRNTEASLRALRAGWLYTGDSGYIDSDGYYYLV